MLVSRVRPTATDVRRPRGPCVCLRVCVQLKDAAGGQVAALVGPSGGAAGLPRGVLDSASPDDRGSEISKVVEDCLVRQAARQRPHGLWRCERSELTGLCGPSDPGGSVPADELLELVQ